MGRERMDRSRPHFRPDLFMENWNNMKRMEEI
jgi:hypothetical protein